MTSNAEDVKEGQQPECVSLQCNKMYCTQNIMSSDKETEGTKQIRLNPQQTTEIHNHIEWQFLCENNIHLINKFKPLHHNVTFKVIS